jgi:hypothetical protein
MTLPALECIRRFLPHVLPEGFHKVRYDGLWSPVHRPLLHQLQLCLAHLDPNPSPESSAPATCPDDPWCTHPSGQASRARAVATACWSSPAPFPHAKGGHHAGPNFLPAYHRHQHHRNTACRLWLPGTDASVSRKPFLADPCTTTSLAPIPPQYPGLHLLSHLRGAWAIRRRPRENASQAAQAGLKFHTGWRSGSVQHSFGVGGAPQILLFVRLQAHRRAEVLACDPT